MGNSPSKNIDGSFRSNATLFEKSANLNLTLDAITTKQKTKITNQNDLNNFKNNIIDIVLQTEIYNERKLNTLNFNNLQDITLYLKYLKQNNMHQELINSVIKQHKNNLKDNKDPRSPYNRFLNENIKKEKERQIIWSRNNNYISKIDLNKEYDYASDSINVNLFNLVQQEILKINNNNVIKELDEIFKLIDKKNKSLTMQTTKTIEVKEIDNRSEKQKLLDNIKEQQQLKQQQLRGLNKSNKSEFKNKETKTTIKTIEDKDLINKKESLKAEIKNINEDIEFYLKLNELNNNPEEIEIFKDLSELLKTTNINKVYEYTQKIIENKINYHSVNYYFNKDKYDNFYDFVKQDFNNIKIKTNGYDNTTMPFDSNKVVHGTKFNNQDFIKERVKKSFLDDHKNYHYDVHNKTSEIQKEALLRLTKEDVNEEKIAKEVNKALLIKTWQKQVVLNRHISKNDVNEYYKDLYEKSYEKTFKAFSELNLNKQLDNFEKNNQGKTQEEVSENIRKIQSLINIRNNFISLTPEEDAKRIEEIKQREQARIEEQSKARVSKALNYLSNVYNVLKDMNESKAIYEDFKTLLTTTEKESINKIENNFLSLKNKDKESVNKYKLNEFESNLLKTLIENYNNSVITKNEIKAKEKEENKNIIKCLELYKDIVLNNKTELLNDYKNLYNSLKDESKTTYKQQETLLKIEIDNIKEERVKSLQKAEELKQQQLREQEERSKKQEDRSNKLKSFKVNSNENEDDNLDFNIYNENIDEDELKRDMQENKEAQRILKDYQKAEAIIKKTLATFERPINLKDESNNENYKIFKNKLTNINKLRRLLKMQQTILLANNLKIKIKDNNNYFDLTNMNIKDINEININPVENGIERIEENNITILENLNDIEFSENEHTKDNSHRHRF